MRRERHVGQTWRSGAAQLAGEPRRVDVGDAAAAGLRRGPDRDQAAEHGDRAPDPDPADQRVDVDPEVRRGRVLQVALLDRADRQALQEAERLPRLGVLRRDAAGDPAQPPVGAVDDRVRATSRSGCIAVQKSPPTVVFRPTSLVASPSKKLRTGPPRPGRPPRRSSSATGRGSCMACRPWSPRAPSRR